MIQSILSFLKHILHALLFDLWPALKGFFAFLAALILGLLYGKKKKKPPKRSNCVPISHPAFKKPDPMIYDQYYLMSLGLAVSWQNPDIQLLQGGVPVASPYGLLPSTTYTIRATIYNASTTGVVYNMPVAFSYLSFGVGTVSNPIPGPAPLVSLGVKGTPQGIAIAEKDWTTPAAPGHYCIQVSFACVDDANPSNNLGQENTEVVQAASPAQVTFQLRNAGRARRAFRFEVDTYQILPPPPCGEPGVTDGDRRAALTGGLPVATRLRNSRASNPLPAGWAVAFNPATPVLDVGQEITVTATITPVDSFHGTQPVNIHAFTENTLAGGVTVTVNRA